MEMVMSAKSLRKSQLFFFCATKIQCIVHQVTTSLYMGAKHIEKQNCASLTQTGQAHKKVAGIRLKKALTLFFSPFTCEKLPVFLKEVLRPPRCPQKYSCKEMFFLKPELLFPTPKNLVAS